MDIGKIDLSKIKLKRPKLGYGWKYIDASIVVMGMLIAVLVWFVPSLDQNKDMQAFIKRQRDAKEYHQRVEAEKARIKKEEEELGLVWIPPPAAPAAPSVKPAPAKPAAVKPAPAKKPN